MPSGRKEVSAIGDSDHWCAGHSSEAWQESLSHAILRPCPQERKRKSQTAPNSLHLSGALDKKCGGVIWACDQYRDSMKGRQCMGWCLPSSRAVLSFFSFSSLAPQRGMHESKTRSEVVRSGMFRCMETRHQLKVSVRLKRCGACDMWQGRRLDGFPAPAQAGKSQGGKDTRQMHLLRYLSPQSSQKGLLPYFSATSKY